MNYKMLLVALAALAMTFTACNNNQEEVLEASYDQMDAIHMQAMKPVMPNGPMDILEDTLEAIIKTAKDDSTVLNGVKLEDAEGVLEQLEQSRMNMGTWMENHQHISKLPADLSFDKKMEYIKSEEQAITKVNDDINQSMAAAQELLKTLGVDLAMPKMDEHHDHSGHDHHDHSDHDGH